MRLLLVLFVASVALVQTISAEPGKWDDAVLSTKDSINAAIEAAKEMYKRLLKDYPLLQDIIKEIEKQVTSPDGVLHSSLQYIKNLVNQFEEQIQDILKFVDEKLEFIAIEIAKALLKEASGLKKWYNITLNRVKDPQNREKAVKILNKFMEKSVTKINKCANQVTKPVHEVYIFANRTAMVATAAVKKIVTDIEICTGSKQEIKSCLDQLPELIREGRDVVYAEAIKIKSQLKDVVSAAVVSVSSCLGTSKIAIEIQKIGVESRIKALE